MALAISCINTVLPVRGGATISARWPLPIGHRISIIRVEIALLVVSSLNFSVGYKGVRFFKRNFTTMLFWGDTVDGIDA